MTLQDVVDRFEKRFTRVRHPSNPDGDKDQKLICAGGLCRWGDVMPALFASEERALEAWFDTAQSEVANTATILEWVLKPTLLQYQMTMCDRRQMQRLVTDRFSVKAQFHTYDGLGA